MLKKKPIFFNLFLLLVFAIGIGCRSPKHFTRQRTDCSTTPSDKPLLSAKAEGIPTEGLRLWLRADSGLVVDRQNRVCVWGDQSGNQFHVRQPDAKKRPKAGANINGQPAINIDRGQQLLREDVLGIDGSSGRTILAVYALDTVGTRFNIYQANPQTNNVYLGLDDNTYGTAGNLFGCYTPNGQAYDGNVKTDAKPHVRAIVANSLQPGLKTNTTIHCLIDGRRMNLVYRCCDRSMKVGDFRSANTTFVPYGGDATLAEVLIYDRPLSENELNELTARLNARYELGS